LVEDWSTGSRAAAPPIAHGFAPNEVTAFLVVATDGKTYTATLHDNLWAWR